MAGKKKLTLRELRQGGKYMLASIAVEAALLAPKTTVRVAEKDYEIGGIVPMFQEEIAVLIRDGLNTFIPKTAVTAESVFRRYNVKDKIVDRAIWFIYDYMEQFTLNSIVTGIVEKTNLVDIDKVGMLRDYIARVLENKDDREKLIDGLTDALLNALAVIAQGTALSIFLNDETAKRVKFTVSDLIDQGMKTESGRIMVDRVLTAVEQFETLTLGGFFERSLGMNRREVEAYINDFYEKLVGSDMVGHYSNLGLGDELYAKISGMDYDEVFKNITQNHLQDLVRVTMAAASVGLYVLSVSDKLDARSEKRAAKKAKKAEKKARKKAK